MLSKIIADLGDNFIAGDEKILIEKIKDYTSKASNYSNLSITDRRLEPYIYNAVISDYLRRGKEGTTSSNDGSLSDSFIDIDEKLRSDLKAIRVYRA